VGVPCNKTRVACALCRRQRPSPSELWRLGTLVSHHKLMDIYK